MPFEGSVVDKNLSKSKVNLSPVKAQKKEESFMVVPLGNDPPSSAHRKEEKDASSTQKKRELFNEIEFFMKFGEKFRIPRTM
jgi:hypothetical protein